jgi:hypothetical protein
MQGAAEKEGTIRSNQCHCVDQRPLLLIQLHVKEIATARFLDAGMARLQVEPEDFRRIELPFHAIGEVRLVAADDLELIVAEDALQPRGDRLQLIRRLLG